MRNVTDVDDDILRKARELGVHYLDLAADEIARFDADMVALGMLPSFSEPRATSAIADIRGFIGMVLDRGHAYVAGGAVYFDVSSYDEFGQVSHLDRADDARARRRARRQPRRPEQARPARLRALAAVGSPTSPPGSRAGDPAAPAGTSSAPPWRCASSGSTIDIHGGGADLIFPHHECEAAQSESATGEPFVRHWMHQAMVRMDGEKMSKSLGNLVFVERAAQDLRARARSAPPCWRTTTATSWEWNDAIMPEAAARVARGARLGEGDGALAEVRAALDDDLDTPGAVKALDAASEQGRGVATAAALLGIDLSAA